MTEATLRTDGSRLRFFQLRCQLRRQSLYSWSSEALRMCQHLLHFVCWTGQVIEVLGARAGSKQHSTDMSPVLVHKKVLLAFPV